MEPILSKKEISDLLTAIKSGEITVESSMQEPNPGHCKAEFKSKINSFLRSRHVKRAYLTDCVVQ